MNPQEGDICEIRELDVNIKNRKSTNCVLGNCYSVLKEEAKVIRLKYSNVIDLV